MKECCPEGTLRAYIDRELRSEERTAIALHLSDCADCHAQYNEFIARAARVTAWMSALTVPSAAARPAGKLAPARPSLAAARHAPARPLLRPLAAVALAVAAAFAFGFFVVPRVTNSPKPVVIPHATPAPPPARGVQLAETAPAPKPMTMHAAKARPVRRARPKEVDYYLALDDEPIETGVIMRVGLAGGQVQADVIFDADGRPRAVRPVR
jgi:hypothetical protein